MAKQKYVHGIGINDADYPVYIKALVCGRSTNLWTCPFYRAWVSMLGRCYSKSMHVKRPTYAGCSVVPEWHSFSAFRDWMIKQDWEGKQLDKDIMTPGNRVYGPDTCVFVSSALNHFLTDREALRGKWPIGVCWDKRSQKFLAQCCNPFSRKDKNLGLFDDPESAHEAWRARKHELACIYADQQTDPRIAKALRTRYATPAAE